MKDRFLNRRGFTLVELLVVITIIGVIVSLFMPSIARSREGARRVICASHFHNIIVAIEAYAGDSIGSGANGGGLFRHQQSIADPLSLYWTEGDPSYIPLEKREAAPDSRSTLSTYGNWQWDQLGGPIGSGAFFPALYGNYLVDGSAFDCPSIHNYAWNALDPVYLSRTVFEKGMAPYLRGQSGYGEFWSPYVGNIYGRWGKRPDDDWGQGFWSSYYIQGYYPYSIEYRSSKRAIMWECGSYSFWLGSYAPNRGLGAHGVGGNELFIDGSVKWRYYSWMPQHLSW